MCGEKRKKRSISAKEVSQSHGNVEKWKPSIQKKSKRNRNEKKEKENTSSEIKARNVRK